MSDRRSRFRFDYTLNVGNIVALLVLIGTLIKYGSDAARYLVDINNKVSIMWIKFAAENPDIVKMYRLEDLK